MSETQQGARFSALVGEKLTSNESARELWQPVAQEFDRSGPEDAWEFLNAEQQRLEGQVQRLLSEFSQG